MSSDRGDAESYGADDEHQVSLLVVVHVDAEVVLTSQFGDVSRHPDVASALDEVRRTHQGQLSPILGVDVPPSLQDMFDGDCWTLEYSELQRCERPPRQAVDFEISYVNWHMQVEGAPARQVAADALHQEIEAIISSSGRPVGISGELLGLKEAVYSLDPNGQVAQMPEALAERIRTAKPEPPEEEPEEDEDSTQAAAAAGAGVSDRERKRNERRARVKRRAKGRRRRRFLAAAVVLVFLAAVAVWLFVLRPGGPGDSIASSAPELEETDAELESEYPEELWTLSAAESQQLSVFSAGVLNFNEDDEALELRAPLTGEIVGDYSLDSELMWTTELRLDGIDSIGIRSEDEFGVITEDGEEQRWPVPEDAEITAMGERPLLHDGDEDYLLTLDSDEPQQMEINPQLITGAADEEGVLQVRSGAPEVVRIPFNGDESSERTWLMEPAEDAEFAKHMAVGHGHSITYWTAGEQGYYVVHSLENGEVTAVLDTETSVADAPAWEVGRGMDLALIENYAVSLATGELVAEWEEGDFSIALGPAAIAEDGDRRQIVLDERLYTEADRVIGASSEGTLWVRQPDGSVAALSRDRGDA